MGVVIGSGSGEWPVTVQHVSNGEPANETILRRPSVDLDNRTTALRTFTETEEAGRDVQLGEINVGDPAASVLGGLQGSFNTAHAHNGVGSTLLDLQVAYNNAATDDVAIKMVAAGSLIFKASDDSTLLTIDNDTKKIVGGASIQASALDTTDITMDSFSDGVVNAAVSLTQEAAWDAHVIVTDGNPHGISYRGLPVQKGNITATGTSMVVTAEMAGETADGTASTVGIVTDGSHNNVIVRNVNNDDINDANGNKVYGRITQSAGVWTLSFFSNIEGTETVYDFTSGVLAKWWVQKIYAPNTAPVYASIFEVPSDEVTAQVNWSGLVDSLIPASDGGIYLGSISNSIAQGHFSSTGIRVGGSYIQYDELGSKIQFKHDIADEWADFGTGTGAVTTADSGGDRSYYSELVNETNEDGGPFGMRDFFDNTLEGTVLNNMEVARNTLALVNGQNEGTYVVEREVGNILTKAEVTAIISLHSLAPKTISGTTTITMEFHTDVAAIFPVGKNILVCKKKIQLGKPDHIHLFDSANMLVQFSVATASYSDVTKLTTITFPNADSYDVSWGYSTEADLLANVEVAPFDQKYEASLTETPSYTELDIVGMEGIARVAINGGHYIKKLIDATVVGTINAGTYAMSENGQYFVATVVEETGAATGKYHVFASKDRGASWFKVDGVRTSNADTVNELAGVYGNHNSQLVKVCNNGKFVFVYYKYTPGVNRHCSMGVTGDLNDTTPTLVDTPAHVNNGTTMDVGVIYWYPNSQTYFTLALDMSEEGFLALVSCRSAYDMMFVTCFTDYGTVYDGSTTNNGSMSITSTAPTFVKVTGSGTTHRVHLFTQKTTSIWEINARYMDQGSLVIQAHTGGTGSGTGVTIGRAGCTTVLLGVAANDTYMVAMYENFTNGSIEYVYVKHDTSTTWSTIRILTHVKADRYNGYTSESQQNHCKHVNQRVVFNPLDEKHFYAACGVTQRSGVADSMLIEVKDITTDMGSVISTYSTSQTANPISYPTYAALTEVITSVPAGIRNLGLMFYRTTAAMPSGAEAIISFKTGVTSGSGSVIQTWTLTEEMCNKLRGGTAYQEMLYFNFDTPLEAGDYHIDVRLNVIDGTAPMFWSCWNSSDPLANGQSYRLNGSTWETHMYDFVFVLSDCHITKMGDAGSSIGEAHPWRMDNMEACMSLTATNKINFYYRRLLLDKAAHNSYVGHPFKRIVTIPATDVYPTITDATCAAYNELGDDPSFDRNLVFNVSYGNDECATLDPVTGLSTDICVNDRSSGIATTSPINAGRVINGNMESGYAILFDSSTRVEYDKKGVVTPILEDDFIIEFEAEKTDFTWSPIIGTKVNSAGSLNGWAVDLDVDAAGDFGYKWTDPSNVTRRVVSTALFTVYNTYRKYQVRKVGSVVSLWYSEGANLATNTFVECTYTQQDVFASCIESDYNNTLIVGDSDGSSAAGWQLGYGNCQIGYIKMATRTTEFAYKGFKNQGPVVAIQALGEYVAGKKSGGLIDPDNAYYEASIAKDGRPFVDSYDYLVTASKSELPAGRFMSFKLSSSRGSEALLTTHKALDVKMNK